MKVTALINPLSGGVGADGAALMTESLERLGIMDAEVRTLEPEALDRQIADYAKAGPDFLIVWGGDGTLRTALAQSGPEGRGLILLPGGTMNLLLRWIHGEKGWETILADVIASPKPRTLPAGRIAGQDFYCALLAGAPAVLAEARESLRRGDIVHSMTKSGEAMEALQSIHLHARFSAGVGFSVGSLPTTSVIGAMVGPLSSGPGMEIAALADASTATALGVVWASLMGDWRDSASLRMVSADTLVIDREEDEAIPLLLDGEPVDIDGQISVTFIPAAAACLVAG